MTNIVISFCVGLFLGRYFIQILDQINGLIISWFNIVVTKSTIKMEELEIEFNKKHAPIEEKSPAIGFHYEKPVEYIDVDDGECKKRNKVGF